MPFQFAELWKAPPRDFELGPRDVHLWIAAIPDCLPHLTDYQTVLAPDERDRAARFHFERDRNRYAIARGVLRKLVGKYVGRVDLPFACNRYGKPALEDKTSPLRFNVAHSRDLALFGFTLEREIGVDVEWMRPDYATTDVAERFFSPDEAAIVAALPQPDRAQGFFNCWTRKEAYIKARGMGLSLALHSFAVTLRPGEPAALVRVDDDASAPQRWTMTDLPTSEGYAAAAAFEDRDCAIAHWRWGTNPS
jgi:4'-phosphopantetheinyl transferase